MMITVNAEVGKLQIQSLDKQVTRGISTLVYELFELFSKPDVLRFHPEIKIQTQDDVLAFLRNAILNFYAKKSFLHFLISKITNRIVGLIDFKTCNAYRAHDGFYNVLIVFYCDVYLRKRLSEMDLLSSSFDLLNSCYLIKFHAIVSRKDISTKKMIKKTGFILARKNNAFNDLYQYKISDEACRLNQHISSQDNASKTLPGDRLR